MSGALISSHWARAIFIILTAAIFRVTSQTGKQMLPCCGTLQNNTGFRNMFLCLTSYLISRLVLFRVFSGPDLRKPQRGVDQPAAVLPLIFTKVLKISDEMTGSQNTHWCFVSDLCAHRQVSLRPLCVTWTFSIEETKLNQLK